MKKVYPASIATVKKGPGPFGSYVLAVVL
jgi:hypothetical protein